MMYSDSKTQLIDKFIDSRRSVSRYKKYLDILTNEVIESEEIPSIFRSVESCILNAIEPPTIEKASNYFITYNEDIAIRPSVLWDVTGFDYLKKKNSLSQLSQSVLFKDVQYPDGSISTYGLLLIASLFPEIDNINFLLAEYNRLVEYIVNKDEIVQLHTEFNKDSEVIPKWLEVWNKMKQKILNNEPEYNDVDAMKFYRIMTLLFRSVLMPENDEYGFINFDINNDNCPSFKGSKIIEKYPDFPTFDRKNVEKYENDEFIWNRVTSKINSQYNANKSVTPKVLVLMKALNLITERQYLRALSDLRLWYYWRPVNGGSIKVYVY